MIFVIPSEARSGVEGSRRVTNKLYHPEIFLIRAAFGTARLASGSFDFAALRSG